VSKDATHEAELNFFYMYLRDAEKLAEWADEADKHKSKLRSLCVRHAILSVVFASEALINRVLDAFYLAGSGKNIIERFSITEKWKVAPLVCGKRRPGEKTFDASAEPFQSFAELITIRNWLVHPKAGEFVDARHKQGETITVMSTGEVLPWVDVLKGQLWPQTRIPKNPFELSGDHVRKAIEVLDKMVKQLQVYLNGAITEEWLDEIGLRVKGTPEQKQVAIDSLWGGYTP
jgi:hypothetical protein